MNIMKDERSKARRFVARIGDRIEGVLWVVGFGVAAIVGIIFTTPLGWFIGAVVTLRLAGCIG